MFFEEKKEEVTDMIEKVGEKYKKMRPRSKLLKKEAKEEREVDISKSRWNHVWNDVCHGGSQSQTDLCAVVKAKAGKRVSKISPRMHCDISESGSSRSPV